VLLVLLELELLELELLELELLELVLLVLLEKQLERQPEQQILLLKEHLLLGLPIIVQVQIVLVINLNKLLVDHKLTLMVLLLVIKILQMDNLTRQITPKTGNFFYR
jgi:hypothetical protein